MKVAVTSQGAGMDSLVDPRFGRAKYFVVVDTDTGDYEAHENTQNLNALQGAGIQAGRNILDFGADAVITGHVGPKAFTTLLAAKIDVYSNAKGTVQEAIEKFKNGELTPTRRPDVDSHW